MINPVVKAPTVSAPLNITDFASTGFFLTNLVRDIQRLLTEFATVINSLVDRANGNNGPVVLPTYVKTALPSAADNINGMIIVSNDIGGLTPAFSDGTNWRRTADRNIIS